jgi:catechol 2,3-dioxygenase-like lactoylglutathione lyase family enzyme
MRIWQLNHVALQVSDVERSVRFFRDVLGLEPMPRPAFGFAGAWFRIGPADPRGAGQELHLIEGRDERVFSSSRGNHFAMLVESMADAERRLRELGVEFTGPKDRPDGAAQIFLRDPDGNVVELCTLPGGAA